MLHQQHSNNVISTTIIIKKPDCSRYKGLPQSLRGAFRHDQPVTEGAPQLTEHRGHRVVLVVRDPPQLLTHSFSKDGFQGVRHHSNDGSSLPDQFSQRVPIIGSYSPLPQQTTV